MEVDFGNLEVNNLELFPIILNALNWKRSSVGSAKLTVVDPDTGEVYYEDIALLRNNLHEILRPEFFASALRKCGKEAYDTRPLDEEKISELRCFFHNFIPEYFAVLAKSINEQTDEFEWYPGLTENCTSWDQIFKVIDMIYSGKYEELPAPEEVESYFHELCEIAKDLEEHEFDVQSTTDEIMARPD